MSEPAYTVIGHPKTRAMRVLWAVEELGLRHRREPVQPRSEEARAAHPSGRVPALRVEEGGETTTLVDSAAILAFLADRHGALTHPPGTLARARQDAAMQFAVCEMDAVLWVLAKHGFALPEDRRVPAIKETARREAQRAERELQTLLGDGPYLAGDAFTIADIMAAHCVRWGVLARVPVGSQRVRDWAAALAERPAYRRAAAEPMPAA